MSTDLFETAAAITMALAYCEQAEAHSDEGPLGEAAARSILAIALKALRTAEAEQVERIARGKMLLRHRIGLENIRDGVVDEGDRAYFRSTNDADELREIVAEIEAVNWDRIMAEKDEPDLLASCRKANDKVRELELRKMALVNVIADLDAICPENWSDEDDEPQARAWAAAKRILDQELPDHG